jgi:hypothetical protein
MTAGMKHVYITVGISEDVKEVWIMRRRDINMSNIFYPYSDRLPLCPSSLRQALPDDISPLLLCNHDAEPLEVVQ